MSDEQTETQPRPNLSTEPRHKDLASNSPTETQATPNLSTEHQREGDARSPSDTLDRGQDDSAKSSDKTSLTRNA
jgi:hypothetical protein